MKKKTIRILILSLTVLLSAVSCFFLPDTVAVQWNSSGPSSFASKYAAVLIPVAVCALAIGTWASRDRELTPGMQWVYGAISCVGIVVDILILVLN